MTADFALSRYQEAMKSTKFLPLLATDLTEEIKAKALAELGETEEAKARAIPELRSLIEKDSKLVCPTDDAYLIEFLRARKYNVKRAFGLLQGYYKTKKAYSDIYDHYNLESLEKVFSAKIISAFPYRDADGCPVVVAKFANWDPDYVSIEEIIPAFTLCILHCLENPITGICGLHVMIDCKHITLKQVRCVSPRHLSLMAKAVKNALPGRFKGIHIYNESIIFQYIWSVIKMFFTEKIKNRAHLHGDNQKHLHKFIPKAILPTEYGGDNPQDVGEWYCNEAPKYFERYRELTTYGYRS